MELAFEKRIDIGWLGEELVARSIPLKSAGLTGVGWRREDIVKVLEAAQRNRWATLGGDVWEVLSEILKSTGDNWYIEPEAEESCSSFVARSAGKANEYVSRYGVNNRDVFFVLVFCECEEV